MAFGRHETFHVRDGWLAKGLHAVAQNSRSLHEVDAHHALGVGTNMLKSLRYWVEASGLAVTGGKATADREMHLTELGELLMKHDPYMDHDGTWWLVHSQIASNSALATTWFWLFNHGPSSRFQLADVEQGLGDFCASASRPPFPNTLMRDLQCLVRTYVGRDKAIRRMGDIDPIGCPLAALGLLRTAERPGELQLTSSERPTLPLGIFMAVLTSFIKRSGENSQITSTEDVRWGIGSPGRIFGMNTEAISDAIERSRVRFGESSVTEIKTAGLSNIQIGNGEAISYLTNYFEGLPR